MKHKHLRLLGLAVIMALVASCQTKVRETSTSGQDEQIAMNTLTSQEKEEGWILMFDGKTADGWRNFNGDTLTGWIVEDGALVGLGLGGDIGGDIVYGEREFGNFILEWEWKLGPNGNSGVMYHVVEGEQYRAPYETGPEYQLIEDDDFRNPDGSQYPLEEWQKTAADYAMYVPADSIEVHVRDWNSSRIVFTGERVEYWINGVRSVEFLPWGEDWYTRRNAGKWDDYPDYGLAKTGLISLQDHGSKVWFRNIKIKPLD